MRLDLCLCGPRRAAATPLALDAAPLRAKTSDPTGTLPLQRDFGKEMNKRWDALRRVVPSLVNARTDAASTIEHAAITGQDPVRAFQSVLDKALKMIIVAPARKWMLPYVRNASDLAIARATDHLKNLTTDAGDWDEDKHPRDDHGRWASVNNGGYDLSNEDDHASLLDNTVSKPLSAKEEAALNDYSENKYLDINQALRNGLDADTKNIDSVFSRASLPIDMLVYRQVDKDTFERVITSGGYSDNAFVSTTANRDLLPKNNVMTIQLPKGASAIPLGSLSSHDATEAEILVNRGQKFKVVSHDHNGLTVRLVTKAHDSIILDAGSQRDRIPPLQTLAHTELQGIAEAVSQQAVRTFANGLLMRKKPGAIARDVQAIVDKVGKSRSALLVGFIILRAFSAATLDTFRAAGITHVGTKPESRSARIVTDAKKSKAPKGKKLSKIYSQERKLQSLGEVDVLTAGDDDVCPICEDISEEGPYDIDTAETLIPAHPNCRCAFVPADDMRFAHDSQTHTAAGIMFHDRTGRVLFVRRSDNSDHAGEWCFPGGAIEPGETAEMAARREALEETGHSTSLPLEQIDRRELGGVDFTTFVVEVPEPFAPVLDSEHTDAVWRMPTDAPEPLHPGVRATIDAALTNDADWNEEDHPRDKIGRFTDGSGSDFDKAQKEFKRLDSSPEGEQMVTNEYGLTYSKRNIAFDNLGGVYRKTADETFDRELTKDEKKSINSYQKNSRLSTKMNETLRSGGKLDEKQTLVSKHLDAVLNDTSLKQDHTLYRGLTGNKGRALVKDLKPGDTITDKGYMSTSLDEDTARGFSQGKKDQDDLHVMRILADKGQHALLTGERSGVQVSSQEYEAILPRGTTLKFHGKSAGKFGVTYYDMEIVKNSKGTKVSDDFNPNQPRDKYGKWTETGAESASAKASAFAETLKNSGVDNVETYHDKANGVHKVFVNTTHEGAHEAFVSASLKHGVPLEHTEIHGDTLAAKFQESDTTPEQKLDKAVAHLMLGGDAEDNDVHKNENYEDFDTGETKPMYEVKVGTTGEFEKLAKQAGVEVQNIGELNEEGSHVGYLIVGHAQPANAPTPTHVEQTQPVAEPTGLVTNEIDFSGLTKVGGQKGSNEGGVYKDKGGNEYYVKSMDEAHAKNERLAASLYQLTGAPTLDYVDVKPNGNTHFVATKFEKLEKGNVSEFDKYDRQAAQVNFATHAWLANWDAAGTGGDNQGVSKTGTVKTLDVGGSLEYRAKGAPKGAAFGTSVEEFNTLRDPSKNADAAKLFGDMTNEQIKASVEKVASIPDHVIRDAVLKGGGTEALADKLIARKNDLNIRAAALGNPALEKAIAAPTTTASTVDHPAKIFKSQVSGTSAERVAMRKKLQELPSYSEEAKTTKLKIIASFWKQHDKLSKTSATKAADIASKLGQYALKYKVANPLTTPTVAAPKTATTVSPVVSTPKPAKTPTTFFKPPPGPDLSSMTEDQVRVHMLDKVTHGGANDWVKSGATELQKSAKLQKAGLTASEIAYVRAFTGPYSGLNKQLRDGHMSEEVFYFKHIMNDALDKFPVYDGDTVWRKISVDDATRAKYNKVGSIVHWPAFSSTAKNPKVWSGNTQFVIHHPKTGRDVQFISTHKSEAEVVMPADTYYKVLAAPTMKKCEDGVTRNVIELEEVVPFGKKKVRAA